MKLEQLLSKTVKQSLYQTVHVPYCGHTQIIRQKCPYHCKPSVNWLKHQKTLAATMGRQVLL